MARKKQKTQPLAESAVDFVPDASGAPAQAAPLPAEAVDFAPDPMPAPAPEIGKLESFARGAGQGATFNFSDELLGLGRALFRDIKEAGSGKGGTRRFDSRYAEERDKERAANKAAADANPLSYAAGDLGGNVATSFIPGVGIAKGANTALKVAAHAGKMGAISGLGASEAETLPEMAFDTAKAGAVSAGTAGIMHRLVRGAPDRAVKRAVGDLTDGATATQRDRLVGAAGKNVGEYDKPGEVLKIVGSKEFKKAGRDPNKLLEVTESALEETGDALNAAYARAGVTTPGIRVADIIDDLSGIHQRIANDPGKADIARAVKSKIEDVKRAWLPKTERVKEPKLPPTPKTPAPAFEQQELVWDAADEVKRIQRGAAGRFEKGTPIPARPASGNTEPYQMGLGFGSPENWLKTTAGKDIGVPVAATAGPMVTAQQARTLAGDIADAAFRGSPAVAPKQGQAISREIWAALKDRIAKNLDEAAEKGGPARKEIESLNKRMSTLLNIREAVRYRATRESTESTRLKDRISGGLDMGLALADPASFVAKNGFDIVGKPALRVADDKLAQLVTAAKNGSAPAQVMERAITLGISPMVAQSLVNWLYRAQSSVSGEQPQ